MGDDGTLIGAQNTVVEGFGIGDRLRGVRHIGGFVDIGRHIAWPNSDRRIA